MCHMPYNTPFIQNQLRIIQYVIVATSELVTSPGGPAMGVGTLATTQTPVSILNINTLLNPPSFFSYSMIFVAPGHKLIALSHKAEKLNRT